MSGLKSIHVPHLGGIDAAYQTAKPYDPSLPTLVMVNSMMTSSELYRPQYQNEALTKVANLLAIEVLGHGQTRTKSPHWTYWDTAIMNLQVLDALNIKGKVFALGTSQGGWIVVRMALLAPERVSRLIFPSSPSPHESIDEYSLPHTIQISGILPLGTSLDYESPRSRSLGCWDALSIVTGRITAFSSPTPTPNFRLTPDQINPSLDFGFGSELPQKERDFWIEQFQLNFAGDDGRRRARMAAINLRDRDGLHARVVDVTCPVLWMHGTSDPVYSVPNAKEEIALFTGSEHAELKVIEGGQHFLSASHPKEVDAAVIDFIEKYGK